MRTLLIFVFIIFYAAPVLAAGQWSNQPGANSSAVPTRADKNAPVYYRFDAATNSGWMELKPVDVIYSICLDSDIAGTGGTATVQILKALSAITANGSYVVEGKVLTGEWPLICVTVAGGRSIMVKAVTAPDSTTAVVSVEAN